MKSLISKVAKWVREVREKEIAQAKRHEEIELERMRKDSVTLGLEFHRKFRQLDLYPGPLSEYSSLKGKECEVVDTGWKNKEVTVEWWNPDNRIYSSVDYWTNYQSKGRLERVIADGQFYKRLLEQGVCGLIHGHWAGDAYREICYVGVPVREKRVKLI